MDFKKIPKEQWDKMSFNEQSYWKLEFDKYQNKKRNQMIIFTRIVAIFFILYLFFIGFAQLKVVNEYGKIKDKYGSQAFCYLCGLENYKKCECQYFSDYNEVVLDDFENYKKQLATYNTKKCDGLKVQDGSYDYGGINIEINTSLFD